jgi:hypothetical protein
MSQMQNEKLSIFTHRALPSRVLAGALALATVVLIVNCNEDHSGCPGPCTSPLTDDWIGPFILWQGPTTEFAPPDAVWDVEAEPRKWFPIDYDPGPDVEPHTCTPCACVPFDDCFGPSLWSGHEVDCESAKSRSGVTQADYYKDECQILYYDNNEKKNLSCFRPYLNVPQQCRTVELGEPVLPEPTPERIAVTYVLPQLIGDRCKSGAACRPPIPEGYEMCVAAPGDVPCEGEWAALGKRYVFRDGFEDARACTDECGCPSFQDNGECTVRLDMFSDEMCMNLVASGTITSFDDDTIPIVPSAYIGSVLATDVSYIPGTCGPPTKENLPIGEIKQGPPMTFCCR